MGYLLSLQPTFTQGLVIGQLSILLLLALVLKHLFLVNDPATVQRLPTAAAIPLRPSANLKHNATLREHGTESVDWLNTVLREVVQTYRSELRDNCDGSDGDEAARDKVEAQLNAMRPAGFVDPIIVHSVDLGNSAPRLSNARPNMTKGTQQQQVEFEMTYTDSASISLSTSVLFNYPFPYFARLPVSLTLSLSVFASKILLTPPRPTLHPQLTLALLPHFTLDLHISSLLGSRAKLADVPKLHEMIESYIKKTLADRGVWTVSLPGVARPQGSADAHSAGDEVDIKLVNDGRGRPPDGMGLEI